MIQNPIEWPNGARCACAITFDVDADSLIHIARPTDGHDRLAPISMGRYGPTVGVPRIVETYRRLGLKQTFFMPAWVMEQYPQAVETILKGGHEIAHHSYLHEDPSGQSDADKGQVQAATGIAMRRGAMRRGGVRHVMRSDWRRPAVPVLAS